MKPDHKPPEGSRELEILAWLEGEMSPELAAACERRLAADQKLREEVDQWRDALAAAGEWSLAEAPGAARVDFMPIPGIQPTARIEEVGPASPEAMAGMQAGWAKSGRRPAVFWFQRAAAAAAIFLVGLWFGHSMPRESSEHPALEPSGVISFIPHQPDSNTTQPAAPQEPAHREANAAPNNENPRVQEDVPPVQTAREEDGKVIIETSLRGSGARALWVVDGGFQVASTSHAGRN